MSRWHHRTVSILVLVLVGGSSSLAADGIVGGAKLLIKETASAKRKVIVVGKEKSTDIGASGMKGLDPADDPVTNGGTLHLAANGAGVATQSLPLPAGLFAGGDAPGWKSVPTGFLYKDPKQLNGPVKLVKLQRTARDVFLLKAVVVGTQSGTGPLDVDIAPPNPGTAGLASVEIHGGNTYCAGFGGVAGGTIKKNDGATFLTVKAAGEPAACAAGCGLQSATVYADEPRPVDIVLFIDNSGSMTNEILAFQNNVNASFGNLLDATGVDYRVILVTQHGPADPAESVCIEAPLSGIPAGGCAVPPAQPISNPPKFFHYSIPIGSHDGWCKLLASYPTTASDEFGVSGWSQWLREDSFKLIVPITDDGVVCSGSTAYNDLDTAAGGDAVAAAIDADLTALSSIHFGTPAGRNYVVHSIVGMPQNVPSGAPYLPSDPISELLCPTGVDPGTGHQALSTLTGGLRFGLCDTTVYADVLATLAADALARAGDACHYLLPQPPSGTLSSASLQIAYAPGNGDPEIFFTPVADEGECAPNSYYVSGLSAVLCEPTCSAVAADTGATVVATYQCD